MRETCWGPDYLSLLLPDPWASVGQQFTGQWIGLKRLLNNDIRRIDGRSEREPSWPQSKSWTPEVCKI
jgi:hypothetical protein